MCARVRHFRFRSEVAHGTSPIVFLCAVVAEDCPIVKVLFETANDDAGHSWLHLQNMMMMGLLAACGTEYIRRQYSRQF